MAGDDFVAAGNAALENGQWSAARTAFAAALSKDRTAEALLGMGQALWWGSPWVAAYGVLVWATTATFVRIYEEPTLREQFGPEYDDYRAAVRAWIPRPRPWSRPADG